jgi:hypothetical protein
MSTDEATDLNDLLAQIGSESSAALTSALERVNTLMHAGQIDRKGLRALREELERARRVGMLGQQISRIGSPRVRIYEEKIDLTALLRDMLTQRGREFEAKGIEVQQRLTPATVIGDVTVVFAMIGALLDWCHEHARPRLDVSLEMKSRPVTAVLGVSFTPVGDESGGSEQAAGKTLSWRLVEVCARKLGLSLERLHTAGRTTAEISFPKAVMSSEAVDTLLEAGLDDAPSTHNSRPLAGSHLLVVCARRDLRVEIRESVQAMGLMIDFVGNVEEAREFCATGLPHAIVFEASLGGAPMQRLMSELRADAPVVVFIEIAESGKPLQVNNLGGHEVPCVARPALRDALPASLTYELSRAG